MRKKSLNLFLLVVAVGTMAALYSCSLRQISGQGKATKSSLHKGKSSVSTPDRLQQDKRTLFNMAFLEAISKEEDEQYAAAFDLYRYCLSLDSMSSAVYDALSSYYFEIEDDSTAEQYVKKSVLLSPDNPTYLEHYGRTLIRKRQYAEASKVYEQLADKDRSRSDLLEVLTQLYDTQHDYDGILRTLDRLEMIEGSSEDLTLAKMHVFSMQGKKEQELAELRKLADKHPYDMNYRVMIGNWLLQDNKKQEALEEYLNVMKKEPENLSARLSLIDYYQQDGQDSIARSMSRDLVLDHRCDINTRQQLLRQIITYSEQQHGDSTEILALIDTLIRKEPKVNDFAIVKAAYMTLKKMPSDSINAANRHVLSVSPDYAPARFSLVQSMWREENFDEVISLCLTGNKYNPDDMAFYYFLGMAYFQKDDIDKSLNAFQRGVSQINEESNPDIVSDFYAMMGDMLYMKNNYNEAFAAYDSCLHWRPENYSCLNNYAYYLTQRGEQLEKAESMSEKTIKAEPNNTTYLDTYAWVLFMRGKYDEAKTFIDKVVVEENDRNAVYLEHAGDIYAKCGLLDEAVALWSEALEKDKSNQLLSKKIKQRKYIIE